MQRSQSCSCPLASSDDPACGGVLRVAGGVVAVAERGPGGGVEERERPPEGSIEGGMDLLKRQDGGGLQRLFFGIAKKHAELKRKARRRGPGRNMANMRLMGYHAPSWSQAARLGAS